MASTFGGLEVAKSGLTVSMQGLNVTGHNIANVDTIGYTRQRIVQQAIVPNGNMNRYGALQTTKIGQGTSVLILDQIRSDFYDRQYRTQVTGYSNWAIKEQVMTFTEGVLSYDTQTGLISSLRSFFNAFNTLTDSTEAARVNCQQSAINFCTYLNTVYDELVDQMNDLSDTVGTYASQINSYAQSLAELNQAIYEYELNGQMANDLRDQRNLILDDLAAMCDIEYYTDADTGQFVVKLAGRELVNGNRVVNELVTATTTEETTGLDVTVLQWSKGASSFNPSGGELAGIFDMLLGADEDNAGIPYFIDQLNIMARAVVTLVNDIHVEGYNDPQDGSQSTKGFNFFEDFGDIDKVTAGNICLSQDIMDSVWNIAISSDEVTDTYNGDYEIAKKLYALLSDTGLSYTDGAGTHEIGGLATFLEGIFTKHDTVLSGVKEHTATYATLAHNMDTLRTSISGVSLDEEMTSLIQYQYAYQGAARVITTIDEALEILINRMGVVGRS